VTCNGVATRYLYITHYQLINNEVHKFPPAAEVKDSKPFEKWWSLSWSIKCLL
jgi:hypothetical protein